MSEPQHLVYLGDEPGWLFDAVDDESAPEEVTVTVAPSAEIALAQQRHARANGFVVDDSHVDSALASLDDRLDDVGDLPLVVRQTSADGETPDEIDSIATIQAATPVAERWDRLAASHPDIGGPDARPAWPGGVSETLHWHDPDGEHLPELLTTTPKVVEIFLNSIVDIFFVLDPDLNYRVWNDSFNQVTGYSDDEIGSMTPLNVITEEYHESALAGIKEILETGQGTAEFTMQTREGTEIPYSFTGSLISGGETGPFICGIGREITERKEREMELRRERDLTNQIIETSPVAIMVIDAVGDILKANTRATKIFGMAESELETYLSDGTFDLYDEAGECIPREEQPVVRALETGEPVYGSKHLVEMPNGEQKWLSKNAAPLTDESGQVSKVVVAIEDITELKQNERELARRTEELDEVVTELKRSNAELEQFAYVASHDLKEPLRVISNYLGLLERRYDDELDEDAQDFIEYATNGAERMRNLIDGLLKYSRTQRNEDRLAPVDSAEVVDTVRSNLAIAIEDTDATVTTASLPTVLGNQNQLVRLFQNLISNAITHGGSGTTTIHVSAKRVDDQYRFAVADDGVGIPAAETEQIFDIFYSGGESDSTGIGLAVCKKIVENHDGRIWAESDGVDGTTVYFTLPTTDAERPSVPHAVSTSGDGASTAERDGTRSTDGGAEGGQ